MPEPVSLMEFLQELLTDAGTRTRFLADPHATLAEQGLAHLSPADVHDALVLVEDTRTADFDPYGAPYGDGFGPPPPAGAGHSDAVQYLSGYLTGNAATAVPEDIDRFDDHGFGEDVDADLLPQVPGHDESMSFGAGATPTDLADDDGFGVPTAAAPPTNSGDLLDFGPDADPDVDGYGEGRAGDPYGDVHPYDPGAPATHHDVDL